MSQGSPLLVIISLFAGVIYAVLLYSKKTSWTQQINILFALIRLVTVALIVYLILSPYIKLRTSFIDKPVIVFAIDNSLSIPSIIGKENTEKMIKLVNEVFNELDGDKFDLKFVSLKQEVKKDSITFLKFNENRTNLSQVLNDIQNNNENTNITSVVLISDGIFNTGLSPLYNQYKFNLYTLGVGDTIPKTDLLVKNVVYNNIVSSGNKFPLVAEIKNIGFKDKTVNILLKRGKEILDRKSFNPVNNEGITNIQFYSTENVKGQYHYTVEVELQEGEYSRRNNVFHVYFDVIDARQNILVVAAAPHPDIKALRSVMETKDNISINVHIPGINDYKEDKYDLVIFHQIPNFYGVGVDILNKFSKQGTPLFFILGNSSSVNELNVMTQGLRIMAPQGQVDKVAAEFNNSFSRFSFDGDKIAIIKNAPPVSVPFGEYNLSSDWETILFQKVGAYVTNKPLLTLNMRNKPVLAVLTGEGIWQWRLTEYEATGKTEAFDELFQKFLQLLSTKEDKRKFKVILTDKEIEENQTVGFQVELYNDVYEKIYGQQIELTITHESGKKYVYSFLNSDHYPSFEVSGLAAGVYKYEAKNNLRQQEIDKGEFTIKLLSLEDINTVADFNLLRELSLKNGGKFYRQSNFKEIINEISSKDYKSKIYNSENLLEIINIKWLLLVLIFLMTIEWVARKRGGFY